MAAFSGMEEERLEYVRAYYNLLTSRKGLLGICNRSLVNRHLLISIIFLLMRNIYFILI